MGCALYGLIACLGRQSAFRWTDDFLGPEPDRAEIEAAVRDLPDDLVAERPADLAAAIVELLEAGRVVGLHQGRSELGPRALGRRPQRQQASGTRARLLDIAPDHLVLPASGNAP
ncbi:hypothetical protein [Microtetraspora fusca]|uniref:hypothetical protein n=1 Tax=Microtetraspora fusca TaxID=1997 RepID=UPI00082A29BD|nr:hypothetical protein [Microtetraspora fusca]